MGFIDSLIHGIGVEALACLGQAQNPGVGWLIPRSKEYCSPIITEILINCRVRPPPIIDVIELSGT